MKVVFIQNQSIKAAPPPNSNDVSPLSLFKKPRHKRVSELIFVDWEFGNLKFGLKEPPPARTETIVALIARGDGNDSKSFHLKLHQVSVTPFPIINNSLKEINHLIII